MWPVNRVNVESDEIYFLEESRPSHFQVFQCHANPLQIIQPAAFKGVVVLKFITIDSRQLQQLPPLQDITHSLISLYLVSMDMGQMKNEHYFHGRRTREQFGMPLNALETISIGLYHIGKTVVQLKFSHNVLRTVARTESIVFTKLRVVDLSHNNITHLNADRLITPQLQVLRLQHNHLVSLVDMTQYSCGNSLPNDIFLNFYLNGNPWNCHGSITWLQSNLFMLMCNLFGREELIYAKPPLNPCIREVDQLICRGPSRRLSSAVVPYERNAVLKRIKFLKNLEGKCAWQPYLHLGLILNYCNNSSSLYKSDIFLLELVHG